jgi:hypothetical protein
MRVVRAWLDAMMQGDLPTALRLYAPDAHLHVGHETFVGRRKIEAYVASSPLVGRGAGVEIFGADSTVMVRWARLRVGGTRGKTRLRIEHDQIVEQWL